MSQNRVTLERQLGHAAEALAAWIKSLDGKGISPENRRRNAKWRKLHAAQREIEARLRCVAKSEALTQELVVRKAEKTAKPAKKEGKGKKPKAAKKGSASGEKAKAKPKSKSKPK